MPASMRGQSSHDMSSAGQGSVSLSYIRNRGPAKIELDYLRCFAIDLRGIALSLRNKTCEQQLISPAPSDIRGGLQRNMFIMYTGAVDWAKSNNVINTDDQNQVSLLETIQRCHSNEISQM
jgi:hypothetical protein